MTSTYIHAAAASRKRDDYTTTTPKIGSTGSIRSQLPLPEARRKSPATKKML